MPTVHRRSLSRPEIVTVLALGLLLGVLVVSALGDTREHSRITDGVNACRNIIFAFKIYASDRDGRYPDSAVTTAKYSNEVFRELVVQKTVDQEKMFGSPHSPFVPDGVMGSAPDFAQAVEAGENHWAMTRRLSDRSAGSIPLVYENPIEAAWEPLWNADMVERPAKGRVWNGGRVVVGRNDGSVALEKLATRTGTKVPMKQFGEEGRNLFTQYETIEEGKKFEVLNVENSPASDARDAQTRKFGPGPDAVAFFAVLGGLLVVIVVVFRIWRGRGVENNAG